MLVDGTIIDAASLPRNSRQGHGVTISSEALQRPARPISRSSVSPTLPSSETHTRTASEEFETNTLRGQSSSPVQDLSVYFHPLVNSQGVSMMPSEQRFPGEMMINSMRNCSWCLIKLGQQFATQLLCNPLGLVHIKNDSKRRIADSPERFQWSTTKLVKAVLMLWANSLLQHPNHLL